MARRAKLEVAIVNIRIPKEKDRDYTALFDQIFALKRGFRVYSDQYLALTEFQSEERIGVFSKYTDIETDGDWFDVETFHKASPEEVDSVSIPQNLRPNLSSFDFMLSVKRHVVVFETYSGSRSLSPNYVEKYLKFIVQHPKVKERFGVVEVDIIKDTVEVDRILGMESLKELKLTIRRPNTDGWDPSVAAMVEQRLAEQNLSQIEETLTATAENNLTPNQRTKNLAYVAAENGSVRGKAIVDGLTINVDSASKPLKLSESYFSDDTPTKNIFFKLTYQMFELLDEMRSRLR
jgi:hypothetical protein